LIDTSLILIIEQPIFSPSQTPVTALDAETVSYAASTRLHPAAKPGRLPIAAYRVLISAAGAMLLAFVATASFAQPAKPPASSSAAGAAVKPSAIVAPAKPVISKPVWAELTVQQQIALRPLAPGWDTISEAQKRKWLEISKGYPSLTPEGQTIMHSRMTEWVGLSAQQRAQARLNFAKTKELSKELTPEEQQAKWQTYQALSVEEKQKLAAKASPKPAGAATAVKPVAPQKLTIITRAQPPLDTPAPSKPASLPAASAIQGGDSALFGEGMGGSAANLQKP
jgi:Protein of unknown function (DUF3106)